jgi:UDP-N-acetylmuramoyl-L-alanyl-D-glutamate--2,6-diaminopimelate ligase
MTMAQILAGVPLMSEVPADLLQAEVHGLDYDSRRIEPGFLFFAFPGAKADGRAFANSAQEKGAIAILSELPAPTNFAGPWIQVEHGRRALAMASRNFYRQNVELTGITGTNGKTTTGFLIDSVLRASGRTTALIGTIEYHLGDQVLPAVNTTPESVDLYRLFDRLRQIGGTHATMEVSSHALALGRVYGLDFHTAVFTNLTRDHLDFHHTMEAYFEAKQILFDSGPKFAVINQDDPYGQRITVPAGTELLTYGLEKESNVRATKISSTFDGLRFEVQFGKLRFPIESPLIGRINVYNILAACCTGLSYQIPVETIAQGIANCHGVPGRFERIDEGQPFAVVVDYSHTDDALRNAILVARGLNPKRVITLFGCGGDRDRTKRPIMGAVAGELSDRIILTSDNPRSEDPLQIMNDVLVGLRRHDKPIVVEPDRHAAIQRAIGDAFPGDIVILAGKGHETYQVLKDRTIPFDDRAVAREVLRNFGYKKA